MEKQTAGRNNLGDFAPQFARLNDDVLFGEVWSKEDKLSPKSCSMITISALMGMGITDFTIKAHIEKGKENGIAREEIVEMITQLAFYAGWPRAWAIFNIVKEVYIDEK